MSLYYDLSTSNEDTIETEVLLSEIAPAEILCYASDVH